MTTRKTVTLTDKQEQEYQTKLSALRKKIQKSRDSGISDSTFEEAWARGEKEGLEILAKRAQAQSGGG